MLELHLIPKGEFDRLLEAEVDRGAVILFEDWPKRGLLRKQLSAGKTKTKHRGRRQGK